MCKLKFSTRIAKKISLFGEKLAVEFGSNSKSIFEQGNWKVL
jgi:hypothetical protein